MIDPEELEIGRIYEGHGPRRAITRIDGERVEYVEEGVLSYLPLTASRDEFSFWVIGGSVDKLSI